MHVFLAPFLNRLDLTLGLIFGRIVEPKQEKFGESNKAIVAESDVIGYDDLDDAPIPGLPNQISAWYLIFC